MKTTILISVLGFVLTTTLHAQVPRLINYQGRLAVGAVNFDGTGQFRFALVDTTGAITYWSNDGTSVAGSQPTNAVSLPVSKGLYSVLLGDVALGNMTALPASVFPHADVRLRVWFNDGVNGSQLLTPDQRLAPSPYLATASVDFNRLDVPAGPAAGQVLGFDGASLKWMPATTGGDSIFGLNGSNASYLAGGLGLGTNTPQARLHVYEAVQSATEVIETGGGTNAWAKLAFRNGNGDWHIGTSRSYNNDVFYIDRIGTTPLEFQLSTWGALGLGIEPQAKLHLYEPANSISQRIQSGAGTNAWSRIEFVNGDGQWNVGTSRNYNGNQFYFHREGSSEIAFAVQPNGDGYFQGAMSCKVLTIRGGADLAEPFAMPDKVEKGAVVVIDEDHPGQLELSAQAYDCRVAGIVSGANGINPGIALHQEGVLEGGQNVALSGRVYVLADASSASIKPGDMLTTSDRPGHAMKATDRTRAQGAILGKAMSALNDGQGTVLVLVTLQ